MYCLLLFAASRSIAFHDGDNYLLLSIALLNWKTTFLYGTISNCVRAKLPYLLSYSGAELAQAV